MKGSDATLRGWGSRLIAFKWRRAQEPSGAPDAGAFPEEEMRIQSWGHPEKTGEDPPHRESSKGSGQRVEFRALNIRTVRYG